MNWFESFNYCNLSTDKSIKELNTGNAWVGGFYLHSPWMFHRGRYRNLIVVFVFI